MNKIFFRDANQTNLSPQQNKFFTVEGGDFYVHESMFDRYGAEEKTINVECYTDEDGNYPSLNQLIASSQLGDREHRQAVKLRGALFKLYEKARAEKHHRELADGIDVYRQS